MRSLILASLLASTVALFAQGCAAEADASAADAYQGSDLTTSAAGSKVLADALNKAKAPSSTPAGITGVGSRIARIKLQTAQGGMAHFISESGSVSTVDGGMLGSLVDLDLSYSALSDALVTAGAKFTTVQGDHGASSSTLLAQVECSQVVAPSAQPSCTVSTITLTESDSETLMNALHASNAPSDTAPGLLGVDSNVARIELDTAQGGIAHFISQSGTVSTVAGNKLGDIVDLGVAWKSVETALLDGGASWTTTNGDHGSSSSKMIATVECSQAVAPSAKPRCTVTAE